MKRKYSREIEAAVRECLEGMDRHFSFDEEDGVFGFRQSIPGPLSEVLEVIEVRETDYVVYAYSPIRSDPDDRKVMREMAAFLTRVNRGLREGNFEFDFRDGEVRYRDFVDCERAIPEQAVIRGSISCPIAMLVRFGAGIPQIVFAGKNAEQAMKACEKSGSDLKHRIARFGELLGEQESPDAEDADDTDDSAGADTAVDEADEE